MPAWLGIPGLGALGLAFLVLEMLVPSAGLLGILAVCSLVLGAVLAFGQGVGVGLIYVTVVAACLPVVIGIGMSLWPKTPFGRRMLLPPPEPEDVHDGSILTSGRIDHLIGGVGRALTPLGPSGMVDFDGRRLDAMSEDGPIGADMPVRAVGTRCGRLIVRAAEAMIPTIDAHPETLAEPHPEPFRYESD